MASSCPIEFFLVVHTATNLQKIIHVNIEERQLERFWLTLTLLQEPPITQLPPCRRNCDADTGRGGEPGSRACGITLSSCDSDPRTEQREDRADTWTTFPGHDELTLDDGQEAASPQTCTHPNIWPLPKGARQLAPLLFCV